MFANLNFLMYTWQEEAELTISKRHKKKAPMAEEKSVIEVVTQTEYIYEDT